MDTSALLENIPLIKFKPNYIWGGVLSNSSPVRIMMTFGFEVKHSCRSKFVVVSAELSVCRHRLYQARYQEQPTGPCPATSKNHLSNNK